MNSKTLVVRTLIKRKMKKACSLSDISARIILNWMIDYANGKTLLGQTEKLVIEYMQTFELSILDVQNLPKFENNLR